jgi:methionyl-tRNA formyltransferase
VSGSTAARSHDAPVIDLYLGGDLGRWTLGQVGDTQIHSVFSYDDDILDAARTCSQRTDRDPPDPRHVETGSVAVCVHYPRVFSAALIARYRVMYNLHPGYLPWGRGYYPVFWALWEQTPAGATLHEIVPALDKGPIVMQIRVRQYPYDTGGSLHERVRRAEREIFRQVWPKILGGDRPPTRPAPPEKGSYHSKADFVALREHADVGALSGGQLLRLVRALTFPGLPGLQVDLGGRLFHLSLEELQEGRTAADPGRLQA